MKITVATDIAAPPDVVFATAEVTPSDEIAASRLRHLENVWSDGWAPWRRETAQETIRRARPKRTTIAENNPPHRKVLIAEELGLRTVSTQEIAATRRGSRMVLKMETVPLNFLGRLWDWFGLLLRGAFYGELKFVLNEVKTEAERRVRLNG